MRELDIQKLKAVILYLLNNMPEDSRDIYHVVKTAYYAQKNHLVKYALPLFNDSIVALKFGPVPSLIYNVLRASRGDSDPWRFCDDHLLNRLSAVIECKDEWFYAKQQPDMECLSESNIKCLDEAIQEVSKMGFSDIMKRTHGGEWYRANHDADSNVMDVVNIARENGASEDVISYLSEALKFSKMAN